MIDFIKATIEKAGEQLLQAKKTIHREKEGGGNWVTEGDIASEQYIIGAIKRKFPTHAILSEETASSIHPRDHEHCWIVDPLDGTTNWESGIPFFGISVAFAERGKVVVGTIYDPTRKELFWAEQGKGAFLNDQPIHTREGRVINIGSPYWEPNFKDTNGVGRYLYKKGFRLVNFGSAALEFAWIACGRLAACYESGLHSWDVAAGTLLVREAGGSVKSLNGDLQPEAGIVAVCRELSPQLVDRVLDFSQLMAHG